MRALTSKYVPDQFLGSEHIPQFPNKFLIFLYPFPFSFSMFSFFLLSLFFLHLLPLFFFFLAQAPACNHERGYRPSFTIDSVGACRHNYLSTNHHGRSYSRLQHLRPTFVLLAMLLPWPTLAAPAIIAFCRLHLEPLARLRYPL